MGIKIGKGAIGAVSFQVAVKKVAVKHSRAEIRLEASPTPPFFAHHAHVIGSIKGHKPKVTHNGRLKKVLKQIHWRKSKLHPLKHFLEKTLLRGRKHPDRVISLLSAALKSNRHCHPDFKVTFSPSHKLASPDTLTVQQVAEQAIQSLTFQIIPEEIRHHRIKLSAILTMPGVDPKARYFAMLEHGKAKFRISHELHHFLSSIDWHKSDLKPLRSFLHDTLKKGHDTPDFILDILTTFIKGGIAPTFILNKAELP